MEEESKFSRADNSDEAFDTEKNNEQENSNLLTQQSNQVTLNERVETHKWKYVAALFTIGLINNNGYVMVAAGADTLASDFGKDKLMPLFQLCLILFSSVTRYVNSKYLLRTQHLVRIGWVAVFNIISFLIIAICCFFDDISAMFYLSLVASIVMGIAIALGESTNLGFLKTFPGDNIGYYGSGTGFAGITGALIFIALKPAGFSDGSIFLVALPSVIPYFLCFYWINNQKRKYPYVPDKEELHQPTTPDLALDRATQLSDQQKQDGANLEEEGVFDNKGFTVENVKLVMRKVGLLQSNLAVVYFLEYTITTSFTVACAQQIINLVPGRENEFVYENAYVIFNLCYQCGVFMSRSSLSFFKIKRVWIITILQASLFTFYCTNAFAFFCANIYVLFGMMVFVGLMGGAQFVNVIYQIKMTDKLHKTEKELALNLTSVFNDIGVLIASLLSLTLSLTCFAKYGE